ncbi:MAG TPA: TonB family protein, partial [Saprospiraceae bacterium]|nr:TonB family protein [Saprospiraceae bacterium]
KEKLTSAKTLSDLVNGYPSSWIMINDYISTEITATNNGTVNKAMSVNETLSQQQKDLLATADLGTEVILEVEYRYKNSAIDQIDVRNMLVKQTVVPEMEAQFMGGQEQLKAYLKKNAIDKISEADTKAMKPVLLRFTINEEGEVTNPEMHMSSDIDKIDKLLLKTIQKMPKWKPAQTSNGTLVKQDFEFSVGVPGC